MVSRGAALDDRPAFVPSGKGFIGLGIMGWPMAGHNKSKEQSRFVRFHALQDDLTVICENHSFSSTSHRY
jgi:hypothetical protein